MVQKETSVEKALNDTTSVLILIAISLDDKSTSKFTAMTLKAARIQLKIMAGIIKKLNNNMTRGEK